MCEPEGLARGFVQSHTRHGRPADVMITKLATKLTTAVETGMSERLSEFE